MQLLITAKQGYLKCFFFFSVYSVKMFVEVICLFKEVLTLGRRFFVSKSKQLKILEKSFVNISRHDDMSLRFFLEQQKFYFFSV